MKLGPDQAVPPAASWLLRLLWPVDWTVLPLPNADDPGEEVRPVMRPPVDGKPAVLYMPPIPRADWPAIVAHAASHRRFGGPPQPRRGLKPVQQALLGVLEDARVEWLALAEWPGLRAWWRPYHEGEQARQGQGFEDLLARLSACLLDPDRQDPHPWIARVRQVFFERDGRTLALRTPQAVRETASRLGHDIGQMRLPFNARTYRVHARYRDDNLHLWLPSDEDREALTLPDPQDSPDVPAPPPPLSPADWELGEPAARYPEWDYRIGRYRPDWVTVYEQHGSGVVPPTCQNPPEAWPLLRQSLSRWPMRRGGSGRDQEGDELHPAALVDFVLAQRAGLVPEDRVWRRPSPRSNTRGVLLLVDASVSTQGELGTWQVQVQRAASVLQRLAAHSAVWAFASDGRHRVRMQRLKDWEEPHEAVSWGSLRAGGSTRLGAVLRHAQQLCTRATHRLGLESCTVILLTDGELHDIDVHDSRYLGADLQHVLRELRARGVLVQALLATSSPSIRRSLGALACFPADPRHWGMALARALSVRPE